MKSVHYIVLAAVCLLPLVPLLLLNSGHFYYTLDDAYIHLALSEGIGGFHYGTNPSEICSPSSSVIWPFLLAPLSGSPVHLYLPLALNVTFIFLIAGVLFKLISRYTNLGINASYAICMAILVLTNQIGLAYTGMEHNFHILLSLIILQGIASYIEDGVLKRTTAMAMILVPLIRFEGLAMSLGAVGVLCCRGKLKTGLIMLAAVMLPLVLVCFSYRSSGLPMLPSSVLVKTNIETEMASPFSYVLNRIQTAMENPRAIRLLITASLLAAVTVAARERNRRMLSAMLLFMAFCHILFGRYGWFARYDVYIMVSILAGYIVMYGRSIGKLVIERQGFRAITAIILVLAVAFAPETRATLLSPLASSEIYRQHGSMRLLARDFFGGSVLANDVGVLSYRNEHHVVDIVGLCSERARNLRVSGGNRWLEDLAREYNAGMAMIYNELYRESIPDSWLHIASFTIEGPKVIVFNRTVDIYVTDESVMERAVSAVAEWESAIPKRTEIIWYVAD